MSRADTPKLPKVPNDGRQYDLWLSEALDRELREIGTKIDRILIDEHISGYDDYVISGTAVGTGSNAPDLAEVRDGIFLYGYAGTGPTTEEAFFTLHILHGIKAGSTPTFHVHWTHNNAAPSGDVKWQIDYSLARGYGITSFPAPTTVSVVQTAGAQYLHHITDDDSMPLADITELEPDSLIIGRLYRDPSDAEDTFADDAFLIQIDMHYERDKVVTPERNRTFSGF